MKINEVTGSFGRTQFSNAKQVSKVEKRYRLQQLQQREVNLQTAERALCIVRQGALLKP